MFNKISSVTIILILLQLLVPLQTVHAQGAVEFSETTVKNQFPEYATFKTTVSSSETEIVSAQFVFSNDGYYSTKSYSKVEIDIQPGQEIELEFIWLTGNGTSPSWPTISYYWDVVDEDGNHYQSEETQFHYNDTRFDWQVLENENVGVWWHDRSSSFGQGVFEIAAQAVIDQKDLFQVSLDYPIRVIIYNSYDEFEVVYDWVGGQTDPGSGVTIQIVESSVYQNSWLQRAVPHEISHLYFAQATHNPTVSIPKWLNEGIAQYNEYVSHLLEETSVRGAAKKGDLIPLSSLETGFGGYNEERVYLAYYESWNAVDYFAETYGEESLGKLLQAYKSGQTTDDAFLTAIGKDAGAFETEWGQYVGVPADYVTPTPWALPTFRPAPTMVVRGQNDTPQSPTPEPASPTQTSTPEEQTPSQTSPSCLSFAPILVMGLGTLLFKGNFRKRDKYV